MFSMAAIAGHDFGDPPANGIRLLHLDQSMTRESPTRRLPELGDDLDFATWPRQSRSATIAESHEIEHRFLRRRLRFFIAREHRQNQCLIGQGMHVPGVQRRAKSDQQFQFTKALRGRSSHRDSNRIGFHPNRGRLGAVPSAPLPYKPSCRGRALSAD